MVKVMRCILLTTVLLFIAINAMAQEAPAGRWWQSPRVVEVLNLTPNEVQRLESAYERSRRDMIRLKTSVEREQFELETMMSKKQIDETAVRQQNRKLEQARSALADAKFAFVIDVRKIIGQARFQKLVDMYPGR